MKLQRLVMPSAALVLACTLVVASAIASERRQSEELALDLARQLIGVRSVAGTDNRTIDAHRLIARALTGGGWSRRDVLIERLADTAFLIATWQGSDPALKPLVVAGHLDVVAADPKDWQRDPFSAVIEHGYLFGRGASDMKFDAALATAALIEMRRDGFVPRRSIVLAFSGDEETTMATSRVIAQRLSNAELVINIDAGGGVLDEASGRPLYWTWQGAEKSYTDYKLEVTNPGGHSSAPRPVNAIVQLAQALLNIGSYHFETEQTELTRSYFASASHFETNAEVARAMRAFARDRNDRQAIAILRATPSQVGKLGTTCVPTMASAGHAPNALPQRATATVNCRIFPGHDREEVRQRLQRIAAVPGLGVSEVTRDTSVSAPASPRREDFVAAVTTAMELIHPGLPVFPSMGSGASDSMWFRAIGVPSYGANPSFSRDSDDYSHGLNERVALDNTGPGIRFLVSLLSDLAR